MNSYQADPTLNIEPSYYSGGVPVFEPTMAQFANFYAYNKAINKYGMQSGIVKVIPPVEWTQSLQGTYTEEKLTNVRIKNPIVQNMNVTAGHQGVFSLQNVERQRTYNVFQWKNLSMKPNFATPSRKSRRRLTSPESKSPEPTEVITPNQRAAQKLLNGPFNIDVTEFTTARCEELEQLYWKSLGYAEPMYGADMLGSLFEERTTSWNVAHLPNILDLMDEKIPGVNDAYLYAGLWKASFSWHLEDQDLYSINYLHFGAPKQWYSIPQHANGKFYTLMKEIFAEDYKNCLEFLRHKTFLASPQFLAKHGIPVNSIVHRQGEYIITYPYGYHAGFNLGFNLAESVNFALDDWFQFAPLTKKCECISDSVGINYKQLYCKLKGITYEKVERQELGRTDTVKISPTPPATRKTRRKPRESAEFECLLCPNNLPADLKRFVPFELLDTDVTNPRTHLPLQVHRVCAETLKLKFRRASRESHGTGECVTGFSGIPRHARTSKCSHCHTANRILQSKAPLQGACFQCSYPKCSRSFHATCGVVAGALSGENLCKQHRTHVSPLYEAGSPELRAKLDSMPENSLIQFTLARGKRQVGEVYCGIISGKPAKDDTLQVQICPSMCDHMEVQYENVLMGRGSSVDNSQFVNMAIVESPVVRPTLKPAEVADIKTEVNPLDQDLESFEAFKDIIYVENFSAPINPGGPRVISEDRKRQADFSIGNISKRANPPTFAVDNFSQPRLVNDAGMVFINEYSDRLEGTPETGRFRFVEESFYDEQYMV